MELLLFNRVYIFYNRKNIINKIYRMVYLTIFDTNLIQ